MRDVCISCDDRNKGEKKKINLLVSFFSSNTYADVFFSFSKKKTKH